MKQMSIHLPQTNVSNSHSQPNQCLHGKLTCGLMRTKSINSTTKSCSTYLSQNRPHRRHTVSRMLWPLDLSSAPEYCVHSVLTGCRHSMQMGIVSPTWIHARFLYFCPFRAAPRLFPFCALEKERRWLEVRSGGARAATLGTV